MNELTKSERREKRKKNNRKMKMSGKGNKRVLNDLHWKKVYESNDQ